MSGGILREHRAHDCQWQRTRNEKKRTEENGEEQFVRNCVMHERRNRLSVHIWIWIFAQINAKRKPGNENRTQTLDTHEWNGVHGTAQHTENRNTLHFKYCLASIFLRFVDIPTRCRCFDSFVGLKFGIAVAAYRRWYFALLNYLGGGNGGGCWCSLLHLCEYERKRMGVSREIDCVQYRATSLTHIHIHSSHSFVYDWRRWWWWWLACSDVRKIAVYSVHIPFIIIFPISRELILRWNQLITFERNCRFDCCKTIKMAAATTNSSFSILTILKLGCDAYNDRQVNRSIFGQIEWRRWTKTVELHQSSSLEFGIGRWRGRSKRNCEYLLVEVENGFCHWIRFVVGRSFSTEEIISRLECWLRFIAPSNTTNTHRQSIAIVLFFKSFSIFRSQFTRHTQARACNGFHYISLLLSSWHHLHRLISLIWLQLFLSSLGCICAFSLSFLLSAKSNSIGMDLTRPSLSSASVIDWNAKSVVAALVMREKSNFYKFVPSQSSRKLLSIQNESRKKRNPFASHGVSDKDVVHFSSSSCSSSTTFHCYAMPLCPLYSHWNSFLPSPSGALRVCVYEL